MSEWQTPKTDWDTNPEAPTGAIMNRIEGNIDYLGALLRENLFYITGSNQFNVEELTQPQSITIPDGYELRLLSVNYYIHPITVGSGHYFTLGVIDGDTDKYFDSRDYVDLYGDLKPNLLMESNTSGEDVTVNIGVYVYDSSVTGWSFRIALVKI